MTEQHNDPPAGTHDPAATTTRSCRIAVGPSDSSADVWHVHGELTLPQGRVPGTVQLLLSGLTYDRRYWDVPGPGSFVRHMAAAGHAVFALDRIGTGQSDAPPAEDVTIASNAAVVHQVVRALRKGEIGGTPFERVIAVGHSLGAGVALVAQAEHADFDALVVTGLLHNLGPLHDQVSQTLVPATTEGYLTPGPGCRATMYEHPGAVLPDAAEHHESTRSTVTLGEGMTLAEIYAPETSRAAEVPVLLVVGQRDRIFGGGALPDVTAAAVVEHERPFYAPKARLEAFVLPEAAHSLNVHRNAPDWFEAARSWIDRLPGAGAA